MTTSVPRIGELGLAARRRDGTLVVELSGELDLATGPQLQRFLRDLEIASDDVIALDLSDLVFIDSSGLRLLLAENERAQLEGCRLVLVGVRGEVLDTIRLIGLDRVLPLAAALSL
jgi:anti-sigma B factor antagonist